MSPTGMIVLLARARRFAPGQLLWTVTCGKIAKGRRVKNLERHVERRSGGL